MNFITKRYLLRGESSLETVSQYIKTLPTSDKPPCLEVVIRQYEDTGVEEVKTIKK